MADDKATVRYNIPQNDDISKPQLAACLNDYKEDVMEGMRWLCRRAMRAAWMHDRSKLQDLDGYFDAIQEAKSRGIDVHDTEWYGEHYLKERSHLDRRVPDDVNLIDVLECIVAAIMEKETDQQLPELSAETLQKAYANTFKLLQANVEKAE